MNQYGFEHAEALLSGSFSGVNGSVSDTGDALQIYVRAIHRAREQNVPGNI